MDRANINDRSSVARVYPFAAFLGEANANVRARTSIWRGVEITGGADAGGWFPMTRASRHAGEREVAGGATFLCPFAQGTEHGSDYPARPDRSGAAEDRTGAYEAFIDKIIATARGMAPDPAPGAGDIRLKGLRQ